MISVTLTSGFNTDIYSGRYTGEITIVYGSNIHNIDNIVAWYRYVLKVFIIGLIVALCLCTAVGRWGCNCYCIVYTGD